MYIEKGSLSPQVDANIDMIAQWQNHKSNFELIIKPMLNDNLALFESLFGHPHYNRSVAVSVVMDVDRVPTEPDGIERVDNGELSGREREGEVLLFDVSTVRQRCG